MSRLQVILAADGLDGVRDVLQDWSAQGLVAPFVWTTGAASPATIVEDGRPRRDHLQAAIAASRSDGAVLTVLVGALAGVAPVDDPTVGAVEQIVLASLGHGIPLVRIRATVARAGSDTRLRRIASPGWHNAVLAPEEATGPTAGREVLGAAAAPVDIAIHAAASLAGLIGLWAGVDDTAFGDTAPSPAASAQLVRSYLRHLDASPAERAVRELVLDTDRELPLPFTAGGAAYVEDVARATRTASTQYWEKSAHRLRGPREQVSDAKVAQIGPLQALGMFFGFLWASLRNAPGRWLEAKVRSVKATAAARMHEIVFGASDSAYRVIVGGVRADGTSAGWEDYGTAVERMIAAIAHADGTSHEPHADLSPLWNDYAKAAFTLTDAGARMPEVPPIEIGTRKGIVRERDAVVPGPGSAFDGVPHVLAAHLDMSPVAPYDVLRVADTERELTRLAGEPGVGVAASATLEQFRRWREHYRSSFAVLLAEPLGAAQGAVRAEIAQILARLAEGGTDTVADEHRIRQKRLSRRLKWIAVVVLLLVAVVVVAALPAVGAIAVAVAVPIVVALVIGWIVASFWAFYASEAEVFRLLTRRRQLQSQQEVDRRNLQLALSDARRLNDAYTQFQRWSEILGAVLARPFGPRAGGEADSAPELVGMPRSIGLGTVEPEDDARDLVVASLRRRIFEPGWLSEVWGTFLEHAHRRLGGRGLDFRDEPALLYRQLGEGDQTVLPALRDHLLATGADPDVGDALWNSALALLAGDPEYRPDTDRLLQRVHVRTAGGGIVSYSEFMGDLDPAASAGLGMQSFDGAVLAPVAQVSGRSAVVATVRRSASTGLSRLELLRQLSGGIPEYEFAAFGADAPAAPVFASDVPAAPTHGSPSPDETDPPSPRVIL